MRKSINVSEETHKDLADITPEGTTYNQMIRQLIREHNKDTDIVWDKQRFE